MDNQPLPTLSELSRHEQERVFELQQEGHETHEALKMVLDERNPQPAANPEALELLNKGVEENLSDEHDPVRA